MCRLRNPIQCIIPPYIFEKLLESKDKDVRSSALVALTMSAQMRGERGVRATFGTSSASANGRRTIFDCENSFSTSDAVMARSEDGAASSDDSANRLFDGLGTTRNFFKNVFDRDSLDDNGMRLDGYVHFGTNHNNAGWNGEVMVFGDGDGNQFTDFTKSLDVIAHELGHGVTQFTANLKYINQSGALNESMSDVFGSMVKQWSLGQKSEDADWLIGAEVWTPGVNGDALRSMKEPGKAYDHPIFGKDPQPSHMSKYDHRTSDNGGVHINSGIPNKAFHLTAMGIGGNSWEAPGHIWYESLKASTETTEFQEFADRTHSQAGTMYGENSAEQQAVFAAWKDVGIRISGVHTGSARNAKTTATGGSDTLAALTKQIESLAAQLKSLAKDVGALKNKK